MPEPVIELRELVRLEKSGEYVCVSGEDEVHVFLQRGRLAWAADTRHPYAFSRYLKTQGGVSEARLAEVIDECAKLHCPIGEKLIEHGLATAEVIHRGLRHQVELAVETLVDLLRPHSVFLTRKFREYRVDLTFELESFFPAHPRRATDLSPVGEPASLLARLVRQIPELCWAQVMKGRGIVERAYAGDTAERVPGALVEMMEEQAVDVTIVRSGSGALVGAGIPGGAGTSLWCEVGGGAALGGAVAHIWTLLELSHLTPRPPKEPPPPLTVGEPSPAVDVALESLLNEPELLGVFAGESPSGLCGATRHESIASMARQRWEFLAVAPGASPRVGTLAGGVWCVGGRLSGSPESLWVVAEGRTPQGMLWAQLPMLERNLARHAMSASSSPE